MISYFTSTIYGFISTTSGFTSTTSGFISTTSGFTSITSGLIIGTSIFGYTTTGTTTGSGYCDLFKSSSIINFSISNYSSYFGFCTGLALAEENKFCCC